MKIWKLPSVLEWGAAVLLFLLLREWLLPLQSLTDTGFLWPFYSIVAISLIIDLFVPYRWLTFPVKLLGILVLLHATFIQSPLWDLEWLEAVYGQFVRDIPLAFQQEWLEMHPISRNLLFDVMLIALASLISYLVLEQRQVLWFVVMSELYLAVLDTFMPYEADGGIMRALIFGFLLLAITHLGKVSQNATFTGKRGWVLANSLLAPLVIIAVSVGFAYAAPKKDPSWPDPVAYLMGSEQGTGGVGMKKVGYDNNDQQLGGPFMQDDTLVFVAVTNEQSYWRGDSKDVYTGMGWEKGEREYEAILDLENYEWSDQLFHGQEVEEVEAMLDFSGPLQYSTIFYPGQLKKVSDFSPGHATVVYDVTNQQLEVRAGKINVFQSSRRPEEAGREVPIVGPNTLLMKLNQYKVHAEVPIVSEKAITQAGTNYPAEIREKYLQLPETLPDRVGELAQEVTKNATTPYEKVRAIESYLRSGGKYRYETTDVPVPENGQDFVDHFLFESYRGYCDHFSTSMTVMLRTLDIPARWVKGFAPGEQVGTDENGNQIIEVRNNDAHSWVEVYFPDLGWVPFEATSSFSSPLRINYDLREETSQTPVPLPEATPQLPLDFENDRLDRLEEGDYVSSSRFSLPWWANALGIGAVVLAAYTLWKRRREIAVWWLRRKMDQLESGAYQDRYRMMIRMVESFYTRRQEGETMREYVNRISMPGEKRQDLRYLTELYEQAVYGLKGMEQKARKFAEELMEKVVRQLKP
ncbi:transglutaminase TgpA family protein [Brevibacillus sp. TJ4]|uniref:transglutaminase TgpA family protein n=1 Tax=Brevibacillus sp. TJ4 TaxID=3234853 RepID=UPI003B9FCCE3